MNAVSHNSSGQLWKYVKVCCSTWFLQEPNTLCKFSSEPKKLPDECNDSTAPPPVLGGDLFKAGISVTARLHPFPPLETLFVFDCRRPRLAETALSAAIKGGSGEADLWPCLCGLLLFGGGFWWAVRSGKRS